MKNQHKKQGSQVSQYLSFFMGDEEYGINILNVMEIRGIEKITPLPTAPTYIKGLINLRGVIIPVMDLRQRFSMPTIEYTASTVIIILQNQTDKGKKILGVVVDAISDVYSVDEKEIRDAPEMKHNNAADYITGLITIENEGNQRMVIGLSVDVLLENNQPQIVSEEG